MTSRTSSNTPINKPISNPILSKWAEEFISNSNASPDRERLVIGEWDEDEYDCKTYRHEGGWKGTDFIHSRHSAVRILCYYAKFEAQSIGTSLEGIVYYSPAAESHVGYCHGGSMCAIFDDVIGWCGFLATGKCIPWSGFTAQINTSLKKPIKVGSILLIRAKINKREGRKVWISSELVEPIVASGNQKSEVIYASGDGLFLLKKESN